jgi:predicted O-methyltransferase YrrM
MRTPELLWLGERAAEMDSVVEIGSLHGRSAFAMLTACKGPVHCIDPWDDEHDLCYASFMGYCGHFDNLHAIRGYSPAAGSEVPGEVDMVFIDGDHSREGITADIEHWLPRTRKLICGHDYTWDQGGYPDVKAVVDEMFGERAKVAPDTAIWVVEL